MQAGGPDLSVQIAAVLGWRGIQSGGIFWLRCEERNVKDRAAQLAQVMGVFVVTAAVLILVSAGGEPAQGAPPQAAEEKATANPLAGNAAAIAEGKSLFRANCSPCHGLSARGGARGPDLTSGRWTHGGSDAEIFRTISSGVPGTQMSANGFDDSETWAIVAYLRSLAPARTMKVAGDPAKGERIFAGVGGCATCHMVNGRGGLLGPDLSRVGAARSVEYLVESIREPDKELSDGMLDPNNHYGMPLVYDTVTVVLKDGDRVVGVAKNEDTFSVQVMDVKQELRLFEKKDVVEVRHERKSLMPAYTEKMIGNEELKDLVAYLAGLRGR
jgi:cytochrome c oxidase cbb3-type subunit 3